MEAGSEIGLQSPVIAKIPQPEMSQMHGYSIEDSGPDSRTKKLLRVGNPIIRDFFGSAVVSTAAVGVPPTESIDRNWPTS
jgi:hypothetical protein